MSRVLSHGSSLMIEYKEIATDAASGGTVFFGDNVHEGQLGMDRSSQQFNLL